MKRLLAILIVFCFAISFAACGESASGFPWGFEDEPSETETSTTAEPQSTPAPIVTDAPEVYAGVPDFWMKLDDNGTMLLDIDFDSKGDTIVCSRASTDEGDFTASVTITLGARPDEPYVYTVDHCNGLDVFAVDCDPADHRLEVLVNYDHDSSDWVLAALRVNEDGSGFKCFEGDFAAVIDEENEFTSEKGFLAYRQFHILGTRELYCQATVGIDGFLPLSEYYFDESNEIKGEMVLKTDLPMRLCDENSEPTDETYVHPAGSALMPFSTDGATYVIVELPEGQLGYIDLEIRTGDDGGIFLGGVNQDEYFDIAYAD